MFDRISNASHCAANFATDSAEPGMLSFSVKKTRRAKTIRELLDQFA
jgi:hypothetical protein